MILIVAALGEELGTALELCGNRRRIRRDGLTFWTATTRKGRDIYLLKTGMGPRRSAEKLMRALESVIPSYVLAVGYAGALDPSLKHGDIVIVRRASYLDNEKGEHALAETAIQSSWELASSDRLMSLVKSAGVCASTGEALTSWHIIGSPEQKRSLFLRFQASIVDMETAALAAAAGAKHIEFGCVRAITDDACDNLLAPVSHEPGLSLAVRAARIAGAGHWLMRYSQWKERSAGARASLRLFLRRYFDELDRDAVQR